MLLLRVPRGEVLPGRRSCCRPSLAPTNAEEDHGFAGIGEKQTSSLLSGLVVPKLIRRRIDFAVS